MPLATDNLARQSSHQALTNNHPDRRASPSRLSRYTDAKVICTFKQGRIADRGQEAQQFRASGLNLVIAAIVYWNSTCLADADQHFRDQGKAVPDSLLAHTSPLRWEHIAFGDFLWDQAAATAGKRRSLNLGLERMAA